MEKPSSIIAKHRVRFIFLAFALVLAGFFGARHFWGHAEKNPPVLMPDEIILLRTPGGMLEVSTLVRNEEFKWSTAYTCPLVKCEELFGKTVSELRVPVHYTYRIALASTWTLRLRNGSYEVLVPKEIPSSPAAIDISKLEIKSHGGWLAPNLLEHRESLLVHFGPEINKRALQDKYIHAQRATAKTTVEEFARKWMIEQGKGKMMADYPVRILFPGDV